MWSRPALTFVNGHILDGDGGTARTLRINGRIVESLDCAPGANDIVIDLKGSVVLPGLVNAHDHLELNTLPRLKWRERHANVREWIADFQPRFDTNDALLAARAIELEDRLWVGGLKNLLAGVTTVCHHNPLHRPLRRRFPVRVVRHYGFSHSLQIDGAGGVSAAYRDTPPSWPWIVHAAEGVDAEAAGEIDELERLGCVQANTVVVHGVGVPRESASRLLLAGVALVWCPTSNDFLFGRTADIRPFDDAGRLAIGSDSRLSGAGDLLDEIRAAHATRQTCAEGICRAVTSGAADVLRLTDAGRLRPGATADVIVLRPTGSDPYESLVGASRRDILMTMMSGRPQVADPMFGDLFEATATCAVPASLDSEVRLVESWIGHRASRLAVPEPGLQVRAC